MPGFILFKELLFRMPDAGGFLFKELFIRDAGCRILYFQSCSIADAGCRGRCTVRTLILGCRMPGFSLFKGVEFWMPEPGREASVQRHLIFCNVDPQLKGPTFLRSSKLEGS